jgi:hypothetical protein
MRQFFKYGSVRGAAGNSRPYRDNRLCVFWADREDEGYSPSQADGRFERTMSRHPTDSLAERSDG